MTRAPLAVAAIVCGVVFCAASSSVEGRASQSPAGKVVARIRIPQNSGVLAVGAGAVWTTTDVVSTLMRIDPTRNAIVARVKLDVHNPCPELPGSCGEAVTTADSVWIARTPDNAVLRIDARDNSLRATIPVGREPEGIATTRGAVWVVNRGAPSVSRIDPSTNRVAATIRIGPARACCADHMAIAAGGGAVWASLPTLNKVVRIDPATNHVVATIRFPAQPCAFLAADARAVWAAGGHCTDIIMRGDTRTNKRRGSVNGAFVPLGLALGFGSLWVADLDAEAIDRVNVRTGQITARLQVGGDPARVAVGFGSVWIRDDTGRVLRISPKQ